MGTSYLVHCNRGADILWNVFRGLFFMDLVSDGDFDSVWFIQGKLWFGCDVACLQLSERVSIRMERSGEVHAGKHTRRWRNRRVNYGILKGHSTAKVVVIHLIRILQLNQVHHTEYFWFCIFKPNIITWIKISGFDLDVDYYNKFKCNTDHFKPVNISE